MARSLWESFLSLFDRGHGDDEADDEDGGFVPSPLDLSVRFAHGGPDTEVERELVEVEEQARQLEENQRKK